MIGEEAGYDLSCVGLTSAQYYGTYVRSRVGAVGVAGFRIDATVVVALAAASGSRSRRSASRSRVLWHTTDLRSRLSTTDGLDDLLRYYVLTDVIAFVIREMDDRCTVRDSDSRREMDDR